MGSSSATSSSVWRYHIPTDIWYEMGHLPFGGASSNGYFTIKGMGYFLIATDSTRNGDCDRQFWEYNPDVDIWTKKADFPDSPRQESSCFVYNDKGYVGQTYGCLVADNHFWSYDPVTNLWNQIASLPTSIELRSTAISVSSGLALLFGGQDGNANFYNNIWQYNISVNTWQNIGHIPGLGRELTVIWGLDSILLVGGGVMVDSHSNIYLANDFYKYNYTQNTWTPVVFQNSFDSTAFGAAFVYNKRGYYFGGASSYLQPTISNKMWTFDASKYIHDTGVGINDVKADVEFQVYPNPLRHEQTLTISTSESGEIYFYDALGRVLHDCKVIHGVNSIRLTTNDDVVFYRATLGHGEIKNGKVVFIR